VATSNATDTGEEIQEQMRERLAEVQGLMAGADESLRAMVADRPLLLLGGTLVAGYLVGRLLGRR
jgi:hypothetical protein